MPIDTSTENGADGVGAGKMTGEGETVMANAVVLLPYVISTAGAGRAGSPVLAW